MTVEFYFEMETITSDGVDREEFEKNAEMQCLEKAIGVCGAKNS